jgi:prolyl oligopeptidase
MRSGLCLPFLGLCAVLASCAPAAPPPAGSPAAARGAITSEALRALFASEWDLRMREEPTHASFLGDHRFDDRWPDVSPAAYERRAAHDREVLARLRAIDPARLPPEDRVSLALFLRDRELRVEGQPFRLWHLALDQRGGVQDADDVADALPFATVHDYEAWNARLRALPAYLDQTTETLREGTRERIVQPRIVMERVPAQLDKQIVDDPESSPFFAPYRHVPASFAPGDRERLVREARASIASAVVPAYRRFRDFFVREYLPACLPEVGAWQLPRGDEAYAYLVRRHTTTSLTPQQVHDIGLREVARIRGEMMALMQQVGFKGSLQEFFAWLRSDPQFFYADGRSLFAAYQATAKRIDPKLVLMFRTLPRTPYGVEPIPAPIAPDTTTAYYREPAADGSRAGTYFVNLYRPEARPRWEMMALTLHESVPGHHLQIALASEQQGLPEFRRHAEWTAFVEGWGLYAESLGDAMGLYDDPYAKFGQLTYEMWRAVRLVVDTGIHALHWDRKRAIAYFLENAPKTELDVTNEVDRYIAWPGQALAYKIGQLEIRKLRDEAQAALGDRFDVRAFHDVVLQNGAMPLDVLRTQVAAWIATSEAGASQRRN